MTRAFAREFGSDGICVNAVVPGLTVCDEVIRNPVFPEGSLKVVASSRCFKRDEVPEDLTGTVVYLASDDGDFVTRQTIIVDGRSALI